MLLRHLCKTGFLFFPWFSSAIGYTAVPRWGQALVVVNDALFIYGGKTDPFDSFSYTSAPSNNDLLYLPLSAQFDPSTPPWDLVSSSSNSSTSQGPALAWHSLSAFNTSAVLLFGGDVGPNSPTVLPTLPNSALILNIYNRLNPQWISESQSWANEPIRRIYHSASSSGGKIFIFGGEKDDGSNNALSDHYVFDANVPSFTLLPTNNAPPDLYGHVSIVLEDSQILVFGGFCQSLGALVSFNAIWILDTTSLTWSSFSVSSTSLPSPRRGFAAVLLEGGKILIHGGSDATLEVTYSDGWILDTTQNPSTWTSVPTLSQLGARRDHFAAAVGQQVIFGFGYGSNGPAPAALQIYDSGSGSFVSSFIPAPNPISNTLPGPSQTNAPTGGSGTYPPGQTPTNNPGQQGPGSGTHSGNNGVSPTSTVGNGNGSSNSDGGSGSDNDDQDDGSHSKAAIALGTTFGVLGLIAGAVAASYYLRRRKSFAPSHTHFQPLGRSEDEESYNPHYSPGAGEKGLARFAPSSWLPRNAQTLLGLAPIAATGPEAVRTARRRQDMLADEDTRQFGSSSYDVHREGSGSSWSLRSVGAMIGSRISGTRSREPSGGGPSTAWREKNSLTEGTAPLMQEDDEGPSVYRNPGRPRPRRELSASTATSWSYIDPFENQAMDETHEDPASDADIQEVPLHPHPHPPPALQTILPLATNVHTLSPLTEQTSRATLSDPASSVSSHDPSTSVVLSPFDTSRGTSFTSLQSNNLLRTSSLIGTANAPSQPPMRRSDTWWARFARTPFLDRRGSISSKGPLDFRDPNPPPRLGAIEESMHSKSPESPPSAGSKISRKHSSSPQHGSGQVQGRHRRSMTSLRTTKTADSEAIERMGGTMDVVQRLGTSNSHQTVSSLGRNSPSFEHNTQATGQPLSIVASGSSEHDSVSVESPIEMYPTESFAVDDYDVADFSPAPTPAPATTLVKQPPSVGAVLSRVEEYERRMTLDAELASPTSPLGKSMSPPARNTRQREERPSKSRVTVNYGLAPRPSLYVANPDRQSSGST